MTLGYLLTWQMVWLRALGIALLLPQMSGRPPPILIRLGLATCMATLLAGVVPPAVLPSNLWAYGAAAASEVVLGLAFGFIGQMTFAGVEMAGRVISSEIGLSPTHGMNAPDVASEPLAGFMGAFAFVLFFMVGGHLLVLSAFARSFDLAAPGHPAVNALAGDMMIRATAHVLELGLRISAPFIALNFLVTLAFATLGRAVARMGVFVLSAPMRGLAGMALFGGAGGLIARYLFAEIAHLPWRMLELLPPR